MNRREFLAAAAVTPIASPILLGTQDKAGTKAPILGSGANAYEALHDWGTLPPSLKWGNTHGVVEDSQGHIYVHHTVHATSESPDSMVEFDAKGKFVRSWGKEFKGVAHGLHIRKEGRDEFLYLTVNAANPKMVPQPAMQAVIVKTTLKGEVVWKIQGPPDIEAYRPGADGAARPYNPTNVAIAPNGDIYVGDGYGSYYINQYDSKANYIRTFGGKGSDPGKLAEPHGIWVNVHARVARYSSSRIVATTACSASRSMASTKTSSRDSGCPATSTNGQAWWSSPTSRAASPSSIVTTRWSSTSATPTPRTGTTRCDASRARNSSRASSFARTAPASITPAISSSSSGSRSEG